MLRHTQSLQDPRNLLLLFGAEEDDDLDRALGFVRLLVHLHLMREVGFELLVRRELELDQGLVAGPSRDLEVHRPPTVVDLPIDVRQSRVPSQAVEDVEILLAMDRLALDPEHPIAVHVLDDTLQEHDPLPRLFGGRREVSIEVSVARQPLDESTDAFNKCLFGLDDAAVRKSVRLLAPILLEADVVIQQGRKLADRVQDRGSDITR